MSRPQKVPRDALSDARCYTYLRIWSGTLHDTLRGRFFAVVEGLSAFGLFGNTRVRLAGKRLAARRCCLGRTVVIGVVIVVTSILLGKGLTTRSRQTASSIDFAVVHDQG